MPVERLTALFQAGKVRTDRRKPAALAAVLAAVMLIASACTPGAPTDTSDPVQSNTPQPTESASAELSQDWPRVSGRLYRRGWQVDYQLALPEEYSGGIGKGITSVTLGMRGCSLALLEADEVPEEVAVLGGKTVRIENLDADGKPIDNGVSFAPGTSDVIVCTGWYIPLDGERRLRLLWPTEEAELGEQVAAAVTWSGLENNPEPDLPLPTAEQMGLTGDAAVLFDALQARYADPEQIPVRSRLNDVMLPAITMWDSYEEDGDTVLVCSVNEMFYYGVQLDGTCDGWGGGGIFGAAGAPPPAGKKPAGSGAPVCRTDWRCPSPWGGNFCGSTRRAPSRWTSPRRRRCWKPGWRRLWPGRWERAPFRRPPTPPWSGRDACLSH